MASYHDVTLQEDFKMSRRQKKKAPVVEEQTAIEADLPTEYIYEDTQCVTGVDPEYKWGDIYRLISRREVQIRAWRRKPSTQT